ncbi:MAG: hypothetical protein IH586_09050 [Anaerolineaceae bacterium]|nr:hypothetical protein [Anaerolineaceae bacterium]
MRLVLDCSNGAAAQVAPKILRDLGAEVAVVNDSLEGDRIGVCCGSEYIRQYPECLAELVYVHKAQYGFSLDGDGDRLVVVDLAGNMYDGHDLIYLLASHFQQRGLLRGKTVVITNQANRGLKPALQALGVDAIETSNGDSQLERALYSRGFTLAGEPGGNIIINDGFHTAADATYTAILVGEALNQDPPVPLIERVAPLREYMAGYPQATRAVRVTTKISQKQLDELKAFGAQKQDILGAGSRVEVRHSSTDPELFRVTVEGWRKEMHEDVEAAADEISDQIAALTKPGGTWHG